MRFATFYLALVLLVTQSEGAEQTLLGTHIDHGGFGGPVMKLTNFNGEFGVLVGGMGAWILNHRVFLGGAAYSLATDHRLPDTGMHARVLVNVPTRMRYGGVVVGYTDTSDELVHPMFDVLIGGGRISPRPDNGYVNPDRYDGFFVIEPTLSAEVNVTAFMQATGGVGYRVVSDVSEFGFSNEEIGGLSLILCLRFGKF